MSQNKIRVILADDNKDFCDVVCSYLNKQEDIDELLPVKRTEKKYKIFPASS